MTEVLIILTNINHYANSKLKTGLWLSELTHLYHAAMEQGYNITLASPNGGPIPIDPESLKKFLIDSVSKMYYHNVNFMKKLNNSKALKDIENEDFDVIYLAGGHGTMYDFPNDVVMQKMIQHQYENNKIVAAICHGVSGLLNVKLSNGEYLIKGKTITGFSWFEETLPNRKNKVPFNLEAGLKARGANYKKACIPMTSKVVVDGKLITGQNPFSSKEMAEVVIKEINKIK
ncbi:type 1 glutamine amidotransferase domain-containing protein [Empedobacter brevis]|uniref:type 1 glutamine amidotransferase domain-containing protein n=1 Tax=Empedobacter brevis TaxID=247 RepID=UPI0039AEFB8A